MSTNTDMPADPDPIELDHSPTKLSTIAAVGAAVLAALTSAPFALLALPVGLAGAGAVGAGLIVAESRTWVAVGVGALFLSVLISGGFGTPVELLLVSMVATVLAWDFGHNAISLGEHVGRHSTTRRNEIIHGAATTIAASLAAAVGYGVYAIAGGGQPVAALSLLLFGIVFLIWAIRT
ncbi:hypothetical protein SAMN06269185_2881 [Natronoarchaeum philippinense]|uniref:Uncharacterized protein n=1 Tax=Natronoarchaeum philippinense TaxID=558529 RepID=A0A285P6K3_NATPI|nr:hypothetical protein [Natronoarchaeum philippinense]SNZ17078.1 hypothetical protein SAMN06269185_2881 [Natronoarchaeum philippinense]